MRRFSLGLLLLAACGDNLDATTNDGSVGPDHRPGTISLLAATSAQEAGELTVTARRTNGSTGAISAEVATADGTATAGADYTATTKTLSWDDGDTTDKTFTIPLLDDQIVEGDETIDLTLSSATGGALLGSAPAATITEDDSLGNALVLTSANRLLSFASDTPGTVSSAVVVSGIPAGTTILGIDVRPATGALYALGSTGVLYTIDRSTGVATIAATLVADPADLTAPFTVLAGTSFGLDFNPVPDRLRVVSNTGQNLRINVTTGATTTDTALTAGVAPTAAAYTNSFASACRTALYVIDPATDRLLLQSPPNDGVATAVGAGLGVDATAVRGFDTETTTGGVTTALAIFEVGGVTSLHGINLTTGVATVGSPLALDAGETVRGFALPTQPAAAVVTQPLGELVGVTATSVRSYERGAPGKACTQATLSGLAAGDAPIGIDARPSTGVLHLVTNATGTGKIYTLDARTGQATAAVTIATPLVGSEFGIDFNPTGPVALRLVSNTGQNLRVTDLATGATTADTALGGATTSATGAAYTDAVQGAGTTSLYVLDTAGATDRLLIQNPPNNGTTTAVGPLGVDLTNVVGFDIDGRDNTGFVAASAGTATTLHTIDLTTGAVSASLGTFGGGEALVGLTRTTPTTRMFAVTTANVLEQFTLADPALVDTHAITGLAAGENVVGLDVRPSTGILYALGSTGVAYRIDPATGAATLASTLAADPTDLTGPFTALPAGELGMDFNPTGPVALRITSATGTNLRVADITAGNTLTDADLARAARSWSPVAAAYANNLPGATATTLYALDNTNDRLLALSPPNSGSVREIGALGVDPTGAAVLEIVGPDTAVAVIDATGAKTLVTIDLATGAATSVGAVTIAGDIMGLAAAPSAVTPAASSLVFGLTSSGVLFQFARNAPGTVTTIASVSNLGALETIEAFDIRPSTGTLYILTRGIGGTGRLYTLDAATAQATFVASLAADPADLTAPYAALGALTRYAIDFNPTGAVPLRILGSDGSNLRVPDPSTGNVITDAELNVAAPTVAGVAYTNNFRGATTTSLFGLDLATSSLVQINPPNTGTVNTIGALFASQTFTGAATFDIAGGNNGLALATLQLAGETFSRLYRINLTRGTATEVGAGVGGTAGAAVRGMAIDVR